MINKGTKQLLPMQSILGEGIYDQFLAYQRDALFRCWHIQQEWGEDYFLVGRTRRCFVLFSDILEDVLEDQTVSNEVDDVKRDIKRLILELSGHSMDEDVRQACEKFTARHYITDTALSSMCGRLAEQYESKERLPRLVVLDELLIHGRGLNNFLFHAEQNLARDYHAYLVKSGIREEKLKESEEKIRSAFINSLDIFVYAENQSERLLLKRYEERMSSTLSCSRPEWRNVSLRFGQLISVGQFSNVGFSWSLDHKEAPWKISDLGETGCFRAVTTHLQEIEQKNYIWFYPSEKAPVLVCTIRFKKNAKNELICVPYIMSGVLKWEDVYAVHKKLFQLALDQGKNAVAEFLAQNDSYLTSENTSEYLRWYTETNELLLTCFLMKKFAKEVGKCASWSDYQQAFLADGEPIRYDQLLPNFRLHYGEPDNDIADSALREIWEMDGSLEEILQTLVQNASPFSRETMFEEWQNLPASEKVDLPIDDPIVFATEDVVAKIGTEAEKNAYAHYSSNIIYSDEELISWGENYTLETVLQNLEKQLVLYREDITEQPNLYQVFAILTQAMDLGLLGMSASMDDPQGVGSEKTPTEVVYTRQRAGEAALFILPIRYRYFLKKLGDIVNQYENMDYLMDQEIDLVVDLLKEKDEISEGQWQIRPHRSEKVMKRQLKWFVNMILSSGQRFREWNIKLDDAARPFKQSLT